MHTILVPVDGSDHSLKALQIACDLAEKYGARIALLHVLAESKRASELLELVIAKTFDQKLKAALQKAAGTTSGLVPENLLKAAGEKILDQAAGKARRRGLEAVILAMVVGDPAENILIAHRHTGAGTIVMGCRGERQSNASSFGSVSNTVFEKAECTCLSVK